ncbi:asparagine--tRNA ligase [Porphyromonadaceae bacterium OttesenSCG-928-L07]|nr:asparagine--tRNA ligase [Porphyromonadaceae bacterium OttesenSCG-928-L07]MDL2330781.1 asparagine--tRNA ligase [Odoribacter sp. OttesenSCG-928-A06]
MEKEKLTVKGLLQSGQVNKEVELNGWVRTKRGNKQVNFIALNDGSTINSIQVVVEMEHFSEELMRKVTTGAAIQVRGLLIESQGSGQSFEIQAKEIVVLGEADPEKYPIQPKKHSLEFLRENAHLRFRTNIFGAIFRIRHAMAFAIHQYFNEHGFCYLHTPLITASDCEGAGEMFRVTTLDPKNPPLTEEGAVDFKQDFFGKSTNLTVSGQLEGELGAMALGKIYTFGPTFRAENSNTTRHLSEFWMIEPEMAFYDITDNMDLAEDFLKSLLRYALDNCMDDLKFLSARLQDEEKDKKAEDRSMELIEKLNFVIQNKFARITYTEAIDILKNSKPNKNGKFQYPVDKWGIDLQSEHERYLVEKHFKTPVIMTDYPKEIKSFYMKQNPDGKTVAAMDVLFPQIGEIIGGSQREENYDKLLTRMNEVGIQVEGMQYYLDTRRYGSAVHSGFGLGFERLLLFVTGMGNIRDVIPFPRSPKNAEF